MLLTQKTWREKKTRKRTYACLLDLIPNVQDLLYFSRTCPGHVAFGLDVTVVEYMVIVRIQQVKQFTDTCDVDGIEHGPSIAGSSDDRNDRPLLLGLASAGKRLKNVGHGLRGEAKQ